VSGAAQTVVVTGASAGVGRATAAAFARQGARIGLIAREPQALAETAAEVERLGGKSLALPLDVADGDAMFAAAERVELELGEIDLWINSAMATVFAPAWKLTPQEMRRVTEVTYLGSVHGVLAALRHMRPRNRGIILQVGSALAYRGIPLQAGYCGAKFAVRGFLDSVRCDLQHEGSRMRVCMVELPAVNTPQFDWARARVRGKPRPVAPVFQPEAVADALVAAAVDPRREYWLGWSTLKTVIGAQVMPQFLDVYLARHVVDGQQSEQAVSPDRIDTLDAPAPAGMHRTRGRFGDEAEPRLASFDPTAVRRVAIGAGLVLAAGLGAGVALLFRSGRKRLRDDRALLAEDSGGQPYGVRANRNQR
jgi:NADP-dependent 3-hydroxy acid dehydrogenase YdfG